MRGERLGCLGKSRAEKSFVLGVVNRAFFNLLNLELVIVKR